MTGKILVVEDQDMFRGIIVDFLRMKGFVVLEASNAGDAIVLVQKWKLDLVLLDLVLPDRSGLDVLEEAKKKDPGLPILVVTGNQDEATAKKAVALGAYDYVVKPFELDEFEERFIKPLFG